MSARVPPQDRPNIGEVVQAARHVTKSFGAVCALKGVSFDVHRGQVTTLLAEKGAGKLTAIAAVVIGGAALTGGHGTVLGDFVIDFLSDGLVIIGGSAYWQSVISGEVIVLAVLLNSIQNGGGQVR